MEPFIRPPRKALEPPGVNQSTQLIAEPNIQKIFEKFALSFVRLVVHLTVGIVYSVWEGWAHGAE
jgi:hypothetical protein